MKGFDGQGCGKFSIINRIRALPSTTKALFVFSLLAVVPSQGQQISGSSVYSVQSIKKLLSPGFRPSWSPDGQWIAYDKVVVSTSLFEMYRIKTDGTGDECLTCGHPEAPGSNGSPNYDPLGPYIVFTSEKASHAPIAAGYTYPAAGIYCDVAVMDLNTKNIYRLTDVKDGLTVHGVGGTLHPRFSPDGRKILWGQYMGPSPTPLLDKFGLTQLGIGDFVTTPTPHLENVTILQPGGSNTHYSEAQAFTANNQSVIFSCTALSGQNTLTLDICSWNLSTSTFTRLTKSSFLNGEPSSYEELAAVSPRGDIIVYNSTSGYPDYDSYPDLPTWQAASQKLDLWYMNVDGSGQTQLTFFNIPGHAEYDPSRVLAAKMAFSPDGSALVVSVDHVGGSSFDIDIITLAASPAINPGGIVNAASYAGTVAPGSLVSVFGFFPGVSPATAATVPLPETLSGLSMQFGGGYAAPLVFAGGGQVNLQVPWELAGQTQTTLKVTINGHSSSPQTVNLAPFAPGIFTMNQQGTGQGAILDTSYRLVDSSNPAVAGSTAVSIYSTGLGAVTNQPASGAASPANPLAWTIATPTVTIGGAPAKVLFWGLAPGFVGEYQVNALVPAGSATGNAVPVVISIGGVHSNTVTMAVKANP